MSFESFRNSLCQVHDKNRCRVGDAHRHVRPRGASVLSQKLIEVDAALVSIIGVYYDGQDFRKNSNLRCLPKPASPDLCPSLVLRRLLA